MADEPIHFAGGTKAQIAGSANIQFLEAARETDRGRVAVGPLSTSAGVLLAAALGLATVAVNSTGSTTLAVKSQYDRHSVLVTAAAGAGAYTADILLPQAVTGADGATSVSFSLGDEIEMRIEVTASANPSVRIWHNAATGVALLAVAGNAERAGLYRVKFRHDGTQWRLWDTGASDVDTLGIAQGNIDATLLTIRTGFNSTATAPLVNLRATDMSFAGKMLNVETDAGNLFWVTASGEAMASAFYFYNDLNTGIVFAGPDELGIHAGGATRVTVSTSLVTLAAGMSFVVPKTITAGATTGAQTIDKMAGSVNFAAAATSLVVTNSLVTTSSVIVATVATNDSTMTSVKVVAGAGSFTIHANAAATAETRVNFLVIN